ncbi:hypothetical protein SNE40_013494 [Patella caerulea]
MLAYVSVIMCHETCTHLQYPQLQHGEQITNDSYLVFDDLYPLQCVKTCISSFVCHAFDYNVRTGTCSLYRRPSGDYVTGENLNYVIGDVADWPRSLAGSCVYHTCPVNALCSAISSSRYVCDVVGCLGTGDKTNTLSGDPAVFQVGYELGDVCKEGYYANTTVVCQHDGNWTAFTCLRLPSNCAELQSCNTSYRDGEYWLYHSDQGTVKRMKIFCYNMTTLNAKDYVTLPYFNFASRSRYVYSNYSTCTTVLADPDTIADHKLGDTEYLKVQLRRSKLRIARGDTTFANYTHKTFYGTAGDANIFVNTTCPALGQFRIDLRNTSFTVNRTSEWILHLSPWSVMENITFSSNNQIVDGLCGGARKPNKPGGCRSSNVFFEINNHYQPDLKSAVIPRCVMN